MHEYMIKASQENEHEEVDSDSIRCLLMSTEQLSGTLFQKTKVTCKISLCDVFLSQNI